MRKLILLVSTFLFTCLSAHAADSILINKLYLLNINSTINPATFNYLKSFKEKHSPQKNNLILIKLNTPGGLISTTKKIISWIGESDSPIIIWITPEGASATSAGAIISSAAHFIFMNQGSSIGAATPIGLSGDIKQEDARSKAINDLVSLVKSLSEARMRRSGPFELMIKEASSFTAQEAKQKNIITGIASGLHEIKTSLHGRRTVIKGEQLTLAFDKALEIESIEMDLGQKLLNIFADPTIAYILFLIGLALIYFEFQAPGGFVLGSFGFICLIASGIGFQVLPLNFGSFGLIILGVILFVLEIFVTSFGLLTLAGTGAVIIGSLFLHRTSDSFLEIQHEVIFSVLGAILFTCGGLVFFLYKQLKNKPLVSFFDPVGSQGRVIEVYHDHYQIKVNGQFWKAISETDLMIDDLVHVISFDKQNLTLTITKTKE